MSADAVLDWNAIMIDALKHDYDASGHPVDQAGPTRSSRATAIVSVAMYDAVVAIDRTYRPYLFDFHAAPGTSMNAAVSQAAHDTLVALFPHQQATFDADLTNSLTSIPWASRALGVQLGHHVAQAMLGARANDGSDAPMSYTPGNQPGQYRPDPLHPTQMAVSPDWNDVTPFVMNSATQFSAPLPPALDSQAYTDAFNQVKSLGGDGTTTPTTRTAEQTEIGIFWAYDGVPGLGTPPVEFNEVARIIAQQQGNNEVRNARMFALVNVAMADAGVAAWTTKYAFNLWRPITGIRESDPGTGPTGLGDGNPNTVGDPTWTPLGAPADNGSGTNFTPAFPSYDSGHADFAGAAFGVLRDFYGTNNVSFSFTSDEFNGITRDSSGNVQPVVTRSYTSLSQAADEVGVSRIYLGIHWSFDVSAGLTQGNQVGDFVFAHFAVSTRSPCSSTVSEPQSRQVAAICNNTAAWRAPSPCAVDHALATTDAHIGSVSVTEKCAAPPALLVPSSHAKVAAKNDHRLTASAYWRRRW